MRSLFLLLALSAGVPSLAHAGVDFKCESVKYEDQLGGWIRFGLAGRGSSVIFEYWNGYPPITLVDAALNNGKIEGNGTRYISEPDRRDNAVATIDMAKDSYKADKFTAKLDIRYISPETKKLRIMKWDIKCVRH